MVAELSNTVNDGCYGNQKRAYPSARSSADRNGSGGLPHYLLFQNYRNLASSRLGVPAGAWVAVRRMGGALADFDGRSLHETNDFRR